MMTPDEAYEIIVLTTEHIDCALTFGSIMLLDKVILRGVEPLKEKVAQAALRRKMGVFYEECVGLGMWEDIVCNLFGGSVAILEGLRVARAADVMCGMAIFLINRIATYDGEKQFENLYRRMVCKECIGAWESMMDVFQYRCVQARNAAEKHDGRYYMMMFLEWCIDYTQNVPLASNEKISLAAKASGDAHNAWNTAQSRFTAPWQGKYIVNINALVVANTSGLSSNAIKLVITPQTGGARSFIVAGLGVSNGSWTNGSCVVYVDAGDSLEFRVLNACTLGMSSNEGDETFVSIAYIS